MKRSNGIIRNAVAAGVALAAAATTPATVAKPAPFKLTNVHFETNASACDMGIQISFDTDGITEGSVEDPNEQVVYSFRAVDGMEGTHDTTEGFQERVEPPIIDLESALGCEPSDDAIPLTDLFTSWPAGMYEFEGQSGGVKFEGEAKLTHKIPAGPEITAPGDGDVVPHDAPLLIRWTKVTGPILPGLSGTGGDRGLPRCRRRRYRPSIAAGKIEVRRSKRRPLEGGKHLPRCRSSTSSPTESMNSKSWATEKGGNQTITEGGVFCTRPMAPANCELP